MDRDTGASVKREALVSDRIPSVIMKYIEPLDSFIRIRVYNREQSQTALSRCRAAGKADYVEWIVGEVIADFDEKVRPKIAEKFEAEYVQDVLISLYQTCVDVNPNLEIHQTAIPVYDDSDLAEKIETMPDDLFDAPKVDRPSPPVVQAKLRRRVVGQEDAIDAFVRFWRRSCAGLRDPERPLGSLMFIGSTGVGKTELAKAIADVAFGGSLIRIDCSEYAAGHEYAKLIGSPPGYVGHGDGGQLTEEIKERPRSVVLFDEIEKADVRIYNLLLQVIDEGRLTGSEGTTVSLKKAFIVLTSNVGTTEIESRRQRAGFSRELVRSIGQAERSEATRDALEDHFPLEFLNRLDDIVVFRELDEAAILRVTGIFLERLRSRLNGLGHGLVVTRAARLEISRRGFDPKWGAREIGRTVADLVEDPISEMLVRGDIKKSVKFKVFVKAGELGVIREWM